MLELLFQGFIEWIYGLILECWEYFASVLFDLMSLDFAYLREHIPIIDTIRQIMLGVGWALLIGNLVFQATRGMAAGLGFDAEDPKLLFTRTFAFSFLLVASPQICELGLNMTSTVIEFLQMPDAVDITFADEASFGGLTGSWLLVVICGIIVMFQTFKLIMEMAERYFILAVLTITSPLAFGMGGSRNTSDIFTGWCRMFGSMCLLMATNVMFVKMLLSVLSYYPSGLDVLPWMVLVVTIVKVAKKANSILARIGLNPAMTGDPLGRGFPGAMTMMVVRSMVSNAAHTLGRNGNQPRSGSGNSKPNAPTGPRSGGAGSASNVNAPSHANGYHHSTSAQQNSANPAFNQESISAQTVAAQTDTVQSATEKMAGAFPQAAPAGNGKQPNSTRKSAVPPGTRRAPGHVAAPKNHAAPTAAKTSPGAPYRPAGASQPVMGGAVMQNAQQEQSAHSQSESHPRSSATVQNHGGTVLPGTAGKTAGQNPSRTTVQPTGPAGKSYHSSNAQGQTVQAESAQQRSTFVQPPDTQRGAPGMAFAPNAMPNNPASTSATPRSPAQPVGSAGKGQMQPAHTETTQQRSTFVQAPNMAGAQPAADHPASPASPRSGMAGNPSVPHSSTPPIPAQNGVAGKQPDSHSAPARDTAGTGTRPQQSGGPQNTPVPGTAGTQRTSIGGRYTQPVQQTTRVSTNGNTQITQQNHVSAQQSGGTVQPSSGARMDGRSTNREHPTPTMPASPAAPSSNRETGTPPRSTARSDAARPAEQRASQRPIPAQNGGAEKPISPAAPFPNREAGASPHSTTRPDAARSAEQRASQRPLPAQNGSAEKPTPQTVTHAPSGVLSDRQRRKPAAPVSTGSMTAPTPVSQESRGPQRSPAAEASAKRPAPQERKAGTQSEPQKKEQTLYHRPGTAGIAPTAVGINTEAASAAQKPAAEKAAKKPFVPLTGRTPESIPSHLDLHEASQKTTKRPQKNTQEVASDE